MMIGFAIKVLVNEGKTRKRKERYNSLAMRVQCTDSQTTRFTDRKTGVMKEGLEFRRERDADEII